MTQVTVLVGNGVSVAYNPDLSVAALTDGVVERFERISGNTAAGKALRRAATQISGTGRSDFEGLLGPLDTASRALDALRALEPLSPGQGTTAGSMRAARNFLRRLYRTGLGEVLDLVASRAHLQGARALDDTVGVLARGLQALPARSPVTVANLSYDGLVHAGLLDNVASMADLASGAHQVEVNLGTAWTINGQRLRNIDDLPGARVHLLHLHGSLGWLRTPEGHDVKVSIDDLRLSGYWKKYRHGRVSHTPLVVLTDRKTQAVDVEPFALAYSIFGERLAASDRWLIAGYSFNDLPVNNALAHAIRVRRRLGEPDPRILLIGVEDRDVQCRRARRSIGEVGMDVEASSQGIPAAIGKRLWNRWAQ